MSRLHDELAVVIHDEMCNAGGSDSCSRWNRPDSPHKAFYELRAQNLIADLEPVIGRANVLPVVRTVLLELDL